MKIDRTHHNASRPNVASGDGLDAPGIPRLIDGYQLKELLGHGRTGAVYRATHQRLNKDVAIKLLAINDQTPDAINCFEREIATAGQLDHPNIVRAMDAGEADGFRYLIMEFVDGIDFSEVVADAASLSVADACEVARQVATGLHYLHQRGLVHRDVKPGNLMLVRDSVDRPTIKVIDLGLAMNTKLPGHQQEAVSQLMGTLLYMSPEQAAGDQQVDWKADVYSLGATLFRLLTGTLPFDGKNFNTPIQRLDALATLNADSIATCRNDLPDELVALVDQMLSRRSADRKLNMEDIATKLNVFATDHELKALCRPASASAPAAQALEANSVAGTTRGNGIRPLRIVLAATVLSIVGFGVFRMWNTASVDATDTFESTTTTPSVPGTRAVRDLNVTPIEIAADSTVSAQPIHTNWSEPEQLAIQFDPNTRPYDTSLSADGCEIILRQSRYLTRSIRKSSDAAWSTPARISVTPGYDFQAGPQLSEDGLTLFFSQAQALNSPEKIWFMSRPSTEAEWSAAQQLSTTINSDNNDGDPCLSSDELSLLFTSDRPGGEGGRDLWIATRETPDADWGPPMNPGSIVNSPDTDTGGTFTSDGNAILFSSCRNGDFDIWVTTRPNFKADWLPAMRLEGPVNSVWNESSPSIVNGTLTFNSDRPEGRVWKSNRLPDGED